MPACNAYRFEQEGHLGWRKRVISNIHFNLFFFFFSMITSSTAHEKSYPTWRRKGIDDFLCVNANAWRNIYVISPVYLLSPLTHIIIYNTRFSQAGTFVIQLQNSRTQQRIKSFSCSGTKAWNCILRIVVCDKASRDISCLFTARLWRTSL